MPCVFPVLAIKVLSFVHLSKETGSKPLRHGLAFGTGILISFWTLTVFIFILKALGQQIGWGFQLQNSTFVGLLIGIFFLLSLSLLGFFEINFVLPSHTVQKNKLSTSFWQGVLAVLVATPCTAPFMGWAIGYAFTQNLLIAFFIFTFIGIGLSFPYVILSASPRLIQKLPKPGGWMETFKKLLALPLLATVFWLGWVLSFQIHNQGILLVLLGLFILSTAIASLKIHFKNIKTKKIIVALLLLAGFGIIFGASTLDLEKKHQTDSNSIWQPYSQEKVLESIRQEKPVFVDFTAKWCLTCQVNKKLVLTRPQVIHYFQKNNFTLLVADWTEQDAGITQALTRLGRSGVPTYVLYTFPDFSPQVLPEILTVSMFTKIDQ